MSNEFQPDYRIPPGETIRETIEFMRYSEDCFADLMDYNIVFIDDLLAGNTPLTAQVADRLERVLGIPKNVWLKLEENYRRPLRGDNP